MHQLLCGVDDTVFVNGYRVQILEVTADAVRLGLSTPGNDGTVHEIRLPGLMSENAKAPQERSVFRPAAN